MTKKKKKTKGEGKKNACLGHSFKTRLNPTS